MTAASLPNAEHAVVPERKITAYLLSESHPDGRGKARFFTSHGFARSEWQLLAAALRLHAQENRVAENVQTPFGVRYIVEGPLHSPDRRRPSVRVVWFTDARSTVPRLVTAYPIKRREQE